MIFITGANGQLGGELKRLYPEAIYLSRAEIDLADPESIKRYFQDKNPELIINCAAYTKVDLAETEADLAHAINTRAPEILAGLSKKFIHFSTDYVFNGEGFRPYREEDITSPQNIYGKTKREGELAVLKVNSEAVIIRTSWVYSDIGHNFVKTMLRLGKDKPELNIVSDQIGSPTYAYDLAKLVLNNGILDWKFKGGIYHYSNEGVASWYDFAYELMKLKSIECKISPIRSEAFPTPAKRPHFSLLDKTKIKEELKISIPHWMESLKKCLEKL